MIQPVDNKSLKIEEFYNFTFLLYRYNPLRKLVEVNIDGKKAKFVMTRDEFYQFVETCCGSKIAGHLTQVTTQWDVYYLYNRQENTNKLINLKKEKVNARFTLEDFMKCEQEQQNKNPVDPFQKMNSDYASFVNSIIYK